MISRSRVPCSRLTERDDFALTRGETERLMHVHVRISISPLREFANSWIDGCIGEFFGARCKRECDRRACLTILVSLSFSSLPSVCRYAYPFLALLSRRPFPRFTLRFRNFPVPRGQSFTIDLPCCLCVLSRK